MKEEFSKLISIKKCPICGGELDRGYIFSSSTIRWDLEKPKFSWVWTFRDIVPFWNAPALRCKQCEIVIFDWEEYVSSTTPKSFMKKCVKCGNEIPIAELQCPYCGSKQN
ncbi:MAG: PF20097 family protein [Candidatus Bathyarchaeia archaeon]